MLLFLGGLTGFAPDSPLKAQDTLWAHSWHAGSIRKGVC
jgi:hypothetical protein